LPGKLQGLVFVGGKNFAGHHVTPVHDTGFAHVAAQLWLEVFVSSRMT
jgi:hypothetical protein